MPPTPKKTRPGARPIVTSYRPQRHYPNLITWRAARGLSQRDAADLLQMSQTMYSRLERGELMATGERARRVMLIAGVPLETLVGVA